MTRPTALLLSLTIAALIAVNSANFFFKHPMYENDDAAAGSLAVDQAKHFAQLYGPYSRWGFYHPGPAFFYVQALGEAVLFDALKIVPAPYNGQELICMFVEVGFLVAALHVFSRWLPARGRWWFFPLALALGTLHFGDPTMGRPETLLSCFAFQDVWSAHILVLIFLSLLAASASVAAGRGEDLPLLVLSGGCLVHEHVAQPMFVLPCALLAYAGLIGWYAFQESGAEVPAGPGWRGALSRVWVPWRRQRRAHLVAGAILAIFLLPLLVDLTRGSQSNFAAIIHHLRTYHEQHKPWLKSLLYFVQFGAYSSYAPGDEKFGDYTAPAMGQYLRAHATVLTAWVAVYGLAAWALLRQVVAWRGKRAAGNLGRFLAWAAVYLFLATGLTLRWGVIQDGEMYYYNAWFNFAIYFFALLIAAALILCWLLALLQRHREGRPGWLEEGAAILATVVCMLVFGQRLKIVDHSWSSNFAMHDRVAGVIAASAAPNAVKFLSFPELSWVYAAAIGLQLDRAHVPFVVPSHWRTMFGQAHSQKTDLNSLERTNYQNWTVVAEAKSAPAANRQLTPLEAGWDLTVARPAVVDLNASGVVTFDFRREASPPVLEVEGWSGKEPWGEWIEGKRAILIFRASPVNADVELTLDAFPYLDPAHRLSAQTLRVSFNGVRIGPELKLSRSDPPPIVVTIPRAVWNQALSPHGTKAVLELDLPDAISPLELDPAKSSEPRELALGVRRMLLRTLGANAGIASAQPSMFPEVAVGSPLPSRYVFDGKPLPTSYCTGISVDGWIGKEATVFLPRAAGNPASFLRLEGVALQRPGLSYPYHFTVQVDGAQRASAVIDGPGSFDVFVPLPKPSGSSHSLVRLDFPQTFNPARTEPGSQDTRDLSVLLRSLAITTATEPVFAGFQQGWYDRETDQHSSWRWSSGEGTVKLAAARSGTLVVSGTARPLVPANDLVILLDGMPCETLPLPRAEWSPFEMRVPLSVGLHLLTFRSRSPGVQPPGDPRVIAFGVGDAVFKLQ